ncbi:MAG: hypothetical protein K8S13_03210 [Desulfobacula sp.]|uniref:hypothetical protein n=1 Tax=Desulfobacula sp. TaxID=2593537 RepID=UPI0025BA106A|nr:hypothetical protein [Desulfobacula sp.]MCD4718853.1 hypothetical protein [Desulfobacula sp.]
MKATTVLLDNDGRRSGNDRRIFSYAEYFPERRSGKDRRPGFDRRCNLLLELGSGFITYILGIELFQPST